MKDSNDVKKWQKKCDKFEEKLDETDSALGTEFAQLMNESPWCSILSGLLETFNSADTALDEAQTSISNAKLELSGARSEVQNMFDALGCNVGGS